MGSDLCHVYEGASMSAIRLVIADVDGTLVTHEKALTPRALQATRQLRAAGIDLAITSGRPPLGMRMLIGPLALMTPIAAFNGGMLVRPDLSLIEQHTLPGVIVGQVIATLDQHRLDVWVYEGQRWYVRERHGPHVDREEHTVQFSPTVVDDLRPFVEGAVKIVGVSDDLGAVARCEAAMRGTCGDHVSAARSQPYYLDVTHPDANKGQVVRRLSSLLGVPTDEIAAIGDMPNDVLMFALSGLPIAMGNASPEVQRAARRVTTSNDEEGFANAVERYVL
jgi:Cof subfamily protein (haloacid dehalogenase superfamily)